MFIYFLMFFLFSKMYKEKRKSKVGQLSLLFLIAPLNPVLPLVQIVLDYRVEQPNTVLAYFCRTVLVLLEKLLLRIAFSALMCSFIFMSILKKTSPVATF